MFFQFIFLLGIFGSCVLDAKEDRKYFVKPFVTNTKGKQKENADEVYLVMREIGEKSNTYLGYSATCADHSESQADECESRMVSFIFLDYKKSGEGEAEVGTISYLGCDEDEFWNWPICISLCIKKAIESSKEKKYCKALQCHLSSLRRFEVREIAEEVMKKWGFDYQDSLKSTMILRFNKDK